MDRNCGKKQNRRQSIRKVRDGKRRKNFRDRAKGVVILGTREEKQ